MNEPDRSFAHARRGAVVRSIRTPSVRRSTAQRQRHDLRRETIVQAAARCFNRKGYHGTTIGDLARELRVSKAALYYYVKSKEALLLQCHETSLDIGVEALQL